MNAVINSPAPRMPVNYVAACKAISACAAVDEVKEWRDRSAAIASYAKQKNDKTLIYQAERIKARATRRLGELLFIAAKSLNLGVAAVAKQHGLRASEATVATRVSKVRNAAFEDAVERRTPPMPLTHLARLGSDTEHVPDTSAAIWRVLSRMDGICKEHDTRAVVESIAASDPREALAIRRAVTKAVEYWDAIAEAAEKRLPR